MCIMNAAKKIPHLLARFEPVTASFEVQLSKHPRMNSLTQLSEALLITHGSCTIIVTLDQVDNIPSNSMLTCYFYVEPCI